LVQTAVAASATPIRTATLAPTQAVTHFVQLSATSPVGRGRTATATAKTTGSSNCTITVTYASGPSEAQGLVTKTADGSGNVSWSWTVGTRTTLGSWPVDVTCTAPGGQRGTARAFFTVQ